MEAIKYWPISDRPREKLLSLGPKALTDSELLAIFLRTGIRGKSAVDLARDALQKFGSLRALLNATSIEFLQIKGFGESKYVQLKAVTEIAERAVREELKVGTVLSSPQETVKYLQYHLQNKLTETLIGIFLDTQNRVLTIETLSEGTLDQTNLHPRKLIERVLAYQTKSVILAHNHPSGKASPSEADHLMTRQVHQVLKTIDVQLLDHLVIGSGEYYSFSQKNVLAVV